ncbi:response regulator transcription factor [Methanocella sp. MCL-LM]|uniref:response regulator transcription factor n=1 Tax=Methanocella sp. MCL-LM TaxID=3412035 RepID=UPI003C73FEDA
MDDEAAIVDMYSKILTASKIPIAFVAYDGEDAIRKFEDSNPKPQIVIMDYRMPSMNGLEASKKIWKIEPATRIIFISADTGVRDEALKAGAAAFIQKPASLREIVLEVKCVIRGLNC